jgi:hypothetical protein
MAVSALVGATTFSRIVPVGLHTYMPAVDLVNVHPLRAGSAVLAALGILLAWLGGRGDARGGSMGVILRLGRALGVSQVAFYTTQALLVGQLQGLPDAGSAILLAAILPVLVLVLVTVGIGSAVAVVTVRTRAHSVEWIATSPSLFAGSGIESRSGRAHPSNPRRGPPTLLPA